MKLYVKKLSSLAKVFIDEEPKGSLTKGQVFKNEKFSFQLAFFVDDVFVLDDCFLKAEFNCPALSVFLVQNVPCSMPCYHDADKDYLRRTPGLFPDILQPAEMPVRASNRQWRSLWFEADPTMLQTGENVIEITLTAYLKDKAVITKKISVELEVLDAMLPKQKTICTKWLHYDCIARLYKTDTQSEEFYKRVWQYVKFAAGHGMNMLMVPLVTPPLDTLPGQERTTMQLLDITLSADKYIINFDRLHNFLKQALSCGIEYFEMTPLFTQWGAEFAPKIMADINGEYKQLFGWSTKSDSPEYTGFLTQLLTQLAQKLTEWGYKDISYFHVSDEPQQPEHYVNYKKAYTLMAACLEGFKIMDTISSAEFFKEGYIKYPIAASDHFESLVNAGAHDLWVYYCCAQYKNVQNHYIAMPSRRTRILGAAMYRQNVWGFLHWGLNFYNGKYSECLLNPYENTDCGGIFPSGDPFLVYPGENGPVSSLRYKVLREAFYDNRALQMLEDLTSREEVCAILDKYGKITFEKYPKSEPALQKLRKEINAEIIKKLGK